VSRKSCIYFVAGNHTLIKLEVNMAIVKVIEVLAESDTSWENAAQQALDEASRTIRNIRSIYIKEFQAIVRDDEIEKFRINAKISFVVDDND
jgi:flavin-binding protein dodecin